MSQACALTWRCMRIVLGAEIGIERAKEDNIE